MDSWRLSKIEEELERIESPSPKIPNSDFPPPPPDFGSSEWPKSRDQSPFGTLERRHSRDQSPFGTLEHPKSRDQSPFGTLERLKYAAGSMERGRSMTPSGTLERSQTPSGTLERRHRSLTPSGTLERSHSFSNTVDTVDSRDVEDIYSKIVVKKGYSREDMEQEAIKHFTGKYESLGKVMLGAMSPKQEVKQINPMGAHEEDHTLPTVFPEPIAPLSPASPQLKSPTSPQFRSPVTPSTPTSPATTPVSPTSPTSPTVRRDIIRPRSKPPPLPPSVPQSPSSPPAHLPQNRPSSASSSGVRSSHRQSQQQRSAPADVIVRRSHSQSSCQRQPLQQHQQGHGATMRKPSNATQLTEADITQVEMFYRSHKTEVFVCQCMANLYEGTVRSSPPSKAGEPPARCVEIWNYIKPGIPVFVLDSGESRRNRKLSIMVSERGTGFPLWKETMTHLTNYRSEKATFHTLHLSNDHTKMMALSFDDPVAANEFIHILHNIASNPDDDVLNLSGRNKKKKDAKKKLKQKYKPPNKADISSPCCFTHVTNLSSSDGVPKVAAPTPPPPSRNSSKSSTSPVQSMTNLPHPLGIPKT